MTTSGTAGRRVGQEIVAEQQMVTLPLAARGAHVHVHVARLARGRPEVAVHLVPAAQHEAHLLKLDISKARSRLAWSPCLRLKEAIPWIVEWYRAHREGQDLRVVTQAQIERYESLLGLR